MTKLTISTENVCQDWFFYLARPAQLLSDLKHLSVLHQLSLLKQMLSQAELDDRKLSNTDNPLDANTDRDLVYGELNFDSSLLYKKSRILDHLSLQISSNLKFNMNLFRVAFEIPVKLLARLYRVLVTNTARSSSLSKVFEQAVNKENIFLINPYDNYVWVELNPVLIYSIMSYHVWCLQVSNFILMNVLIRFLYRSVCYNNLLET